LTIEAFKKTLDTAIPGDSVGLCLKGVLKEQIHRGQCITAPGKFIVNRTFKAQIYVLKADEGGRHKPFFSGYRP
jgi:elongation factor Tu